MKRFLKSFIHAIHGINYAFQGHNFLVQIGLAIIAIILAFYFHISTTEWLFIVFAIGLVLSLEATNTAVEEICNKFHPEEHPHIALIKDTAAGAVLISAITAFVIGIIIFLPYIV